MCYSKSVSGPMIPVDLKRAERLRVLAQFNDMLRRLWREGLDSGDGGEVDFAALKAEARVLAQREPGV